MKLLYVLSILAIAALVGCGDNGPFEYVPVSGKLTYEDGSLVTGAKNLRLGFISQEHQENLNQRPRPAKAPINLADGTFDHATSYKYADGLVPGKHLVVIVARGDRGGAAKVTKPEYTSAATSPLIVDTADAPFHIKIPKP